MNAYSFSSSPYARGWLRWWFPWTIWTRHICLKRCSVGNGFRFFFKPSPIVLRHKVIILFNNCDCKKGAVPRSFAGSGTISYSFLKWSTRSFKLSVTFVINRFFSPILAVPDAARTNWNKAEEWWRAFGNVSGPKGAPFSTNSENKSVIDGSEIGLTSRRKPLKHFSSLRESVLVSFIILKRSTRGFPRIRLLQRHPNTFLVWALAFRSDPSLIK